MSQRQFKHIKILKILIIKKYSNLKLLKDLMYFNSHKIKINLLIIYGIIIMKNMKRQNLNHLNLRKTQKMNKTFIIHLTIQKQTHNSIN